MYSSKTTKQASDILENYFNILSQTGYYKYPSVYKILVFLFIDDILNTEMNTFITEDDYKLMVDILECLYGSECLIPYPEFKELTTTLSTILGSSSIYRITNDYSTRITEDSFFRNTESYTDYWDR